jgi:hypothetical protein
MPMVPKLLTIFAASTELQVPERTIAAKLRHIKPDGKVGRNRLTTILRALGSG